MSGSWLGGGNWLTNQFILCPNLHGNEWQWMNMPLKTWRCNCEYIKTRDNTDAALDRGRAASVLMPAKPIVAVWNCNESEWKLSSRAGRAALEKWLLSGFTEKRWMLTNTCSVLLRENQQNIAFTEKRCISRKFSPAEPSENYRPELVARAGLAGSAAHAFHFVNNDYWAVLRWRNGGYRGCQKSGTLSKVATRW